MHGLLGFNLGRKSLSCLLKMTRERWRVRCLYFVGFLDLFGVSIFLPLITHRARELGASPSKVGAIGSIYGGLQFFSSPVMGRLSDVYGRKRILLLTLFGSALGYFFSGLPTTLLFLALSRVPLGILKHSQSVSKTYLADIMPPEQHARVFGNFNAYSSLGFSIGPLIGGHLAMQSNGFSKVTLLTAVIFFINFLFVWLCVKDVEPTKAQMLVMKEETEETGTSDTGQVHTVDIKNELKERGNRRKFQPNEMTDASSMTTASTTSNIVKVAAITSILDLILIRFLMGFAMLMFRSNFTTLLEFHFGTSPTMNGYLLSYNGLISGFCGILVGPISKLYSHNDSRMLLHFSIILTLSILGITFSPNIPIVASFILPLSLSSAVSRVCVTNLTFQRGCENDKGVLLGIGNSMLSFARMISPALGGVAMEATVYGPGSIGAGIAAIGILVMVFYPQGRMQVLQNEKKTS